MVNLVKCDFFSYVIFLVPVKLYMLTHFNASKFGRFGRRCVSAFSDIV